MEVELSSHFVKRAKRLSVEEKAELSKRTEWFRKNLKDPRLKTHALGGNLKGRFSFSLTFGKRVKFVYLNSELVLFVDVGSHDEVYK